MHSVCWENDRSAVPPALLPYLSRARLMIYPRAGFEHLPGPRAEKAEAQGESDDAEAGDRWLPLLWGGVLGLVFSGLLLITLLLGKLAASREPAPAFEPVSLPALPLLTAYVLGGLASGAVGALLYPLARRSSGAFLLGAVAHLPLFLSIGWAVRPLSQWSPVMLGGVAMAALIFGVAWARMVRLDLPRGES